MSAKRMIKIITGNIDSGKTTFVKEVAKGWGLAGILSLKVFSNGMHIGYNAFDLLTNRTYILARKKDIELLEGPCIGDYNFSQHTFDILTEQYSGFTKNMVIDEIGPLELQDKGFSKLLENLLANRSVDTDLVLVIRNRCLYACIDKWNLEPSEIIKR